MTFTKQSVNHNIIIRGHELIVDFSFMNLLIAETHDSRQQTLSLQNPF